MKHFFPFSINVYEQKFIVINKIILSGYVGTGMLSASVSGSVFAAPPSNHVLHAIQCVSTNNNGIYNLEIAFLPQLKKICIIYYILGTFNALFQFLAGCLVIIPNYTGDCLNFGLAIEKSRNLGLKVSETKIIINK